MKTSVTRRVEWDMGHRVPDHRSLCANAHGHRYVVEVEIQDRVIHESGNPENGMVIDFSSLKAAMLQVVSGLDHGFMIFRGDPWLETFVSLDTKLIVVDFVPTAEEIAKFLFTQIQSLLQVVVNRVTVWETPTCQATVTR